MPSPLARSNITLSPRGRGWLRASGAKPGEGASSQEFIFPMHSVREPLIRPTLAIAPRGPPSPSRGEGNEFASRATLIERFKQPTLRRPYSCAGAGCALFPFFSLTQGEGSGAPRGAPQPRLARRGARNDAARSPRGAPLRLAMQPESRMTDPGPRFRETAPRDRPVQRAPRSAVVVPHGRSPEASREPS